MPRENPNTPRLRESVARILAEGKSALLLHRNSRGPYGLGADTTHVQRVGERRYRSARWYRGRWSRSQDSADSLDELLAKIFDGSCSAPSEPRRVIGDDSVLKGSVCWVSGMDEPGPTRKEATEAAADAKTAAWLEECRRRKANDEDHRRRIAAIDARKREADRRGSERQRREEARRPPPMERFIAQGLRPFSAANLHGLAVARRLGTETQRHWTEGVNWTLATDILPSARQLVAVRGGAAPGTPFCRMSRNGRLWEVEDCDHKFSTDGTKWGFRQDL